MLACKHLIVTIISKVKKTRVFPIWKACNMYGSYITQSGKLFSGGDG